MPLNPTQWTLHFEISLFKKIMGRMKKKKKKKLLKAQFITVSEFIVIC